VLLRGFEVSTAEEFARFFRDVFGPPLTYTYQSTPRTEIGRGIYTASEYPADQTIPLHNEMSYSTSWPAVIGFFCECSAASRGATTLADSRETYRRLPVALRDRFEKLGILYVRNYGATLDLPWQRVFGTDDRTEAEFRFRRQNLSYEWSADGDLRTWQVCQAAISHPVSGEKVWFNQAHLFHVSSLPLPVREALSAAMPESRFPRNCYYGDGSPIEESVLAEIRGVYGELARSFQWQRGDLLIVDNVHTAHGREPYTGSRRVLVAMAAGIGLQDGGRDDV
jgi:hypothetical protein